VVSAKHGHVLFCVFCSNVVTPAVEIITISPKLNIIRKKKGGKLDL
jgi:hypothetical protein